MLEIKCSELELAWPQARIQGQTQVQQSLVGARRRRSPEDRHLGTWVGRRRSAVVATRDRETGARENHEREYARGDAMALC